MKAMLFKIVQIGTAHLIQQRLILIGQKALVQLLLSLGPGRKFLLGKYQMQLGLEVLLV